MRRALLACGSVLFSPIAAHAEEHVQIDYALPSVTVSAGVAQRITDCPIAADAQWDLKEGDPGLRIAFAYKVAIAGKAAPRRLVRLDTESGFLVDRETKVHFNDDWYLKDFNGKTTGQGGPLLVSLIKAGVAAYAMTANPILGVGAAATVIKGMPLTEGPDRPVARQHYFARHWYLECQPDVGANLVNLEKRRDDVAGLEARVIGGDTSPATQELLTLRRAQVGELEAALTMNATLKGGLAPALDTNGNIVNLSGQIEAPDLKRWFKVTSVRKEVKAKGFEADDSEPTILALLSKRQPKLPGIYGYQVSVVPDTKLAAWFGCDPKAVDAACAAAVRMDTPLMTRDLVYLRPIPAGVKLWPNPIVCAAGTVCAADSSWTAAKDASGSGDVKLPQLSRLYTMRTGGSIFGGRTVGAEFGPMGEPTMLQYNIGSASKDVAGVLDAGVAAAQSARDAQGAATKRKLDELKNARDLQDLLDELDTPAS